MKSPGGSIYPYYYKGGALHCLKYGSMYSDSEQLFEIMKKEEEFVLAEGRKLNIWIDLYQTRMNGKVLGELADHILRLNGCIHKLAVVGLSDWNTWRMKSQIRRKRIPLRIAYYADPEEAKTWLVGER